jgi:hypothetical protein
MIVLSRRPVIMQVSKIGRVAGSPDGLLAPCRVLEACCQFRRQTARLAQGRSDLNSYCREVPQQAQISTDSCGRSGTVTCTGVLRWTWCH